MSLGPNIQKLQSFVKSAPNNQLIQFAQNPSVGSDPLISLLAVTELGRRERVRQAMQSPPSPQPTVAQQVVQQAVPPPPQRLGPPPSMAMSAPPASPPMPPSEAGVASLPYEANYADGGIVSFANRGYVEGNGDAWGEYADEKRLGPGVLEAYQQIRSSLEEGQPLETMMPGSWVRASELAPSDVRDALKNSPWRHTGFGSTNILPSTAEAPATDDGKYSITAATPTTAEAPFSYVSELVKAKKELADAGLGYGGAGAGAGAARDYTKMLPYVDVDVPKALSLTDAFKERAEAEKLGGIKDIYGPLGERLKTKEERATQSRDRDRWLSLAQAGLTMAQTPGSFGVALAKGAQAGLGSLADVNKRYEEAQDKIDESRQLLTIAEHQEKAGKVKDAMATRQASIDAERQGNFEKAKLRAEVEARRVTAAQNDAQTAATLESARIGAQGRLAAGVIEAKLAERKADAAYKARMNAARMAALQRIRAGDQKAKLEIAKQVNQWMKDVGENELAKWESELKKKGQIPSAKDKEQKRLLIRQAGEQQALSSYGMTLPEVTMSDLMPFASNYGGLAADNGD